VLNARISATAGLTSMSITRSGTSAQYRPASRMQAKTSVVPMSGCSMTSAMGSTTIATGFQRSQIDCAGSRQRESRWASIRMTEILATSAVWMRIGPIASQRGTPSAVPAPVPMIGVSASMTIART
jgi:hypothetical protein